MQSSDGMERAGQAALVGWRRRVGEPVAERVAAHTPFDVARVEAAIGIAFLVLSALYVGRALARIARSGG
jgi:hypothetical protein